MLLHNKKLPSLTSSMSIIMLYLLVFTVILIDKTSGVLNSRPIIGVIAQETHAGLYNQSFVAASYVKALEASGARVVPVFINKTESYYRETMSYINGILIPGGSAEFNVSGGFAEAVITVYNIAKDIARNEKQIFPILGICQGMEILSYIASDQQNPLIPCGSDNMNLPLNFKPNYQYSKLYKHLKPEYREIFKTKNVTNNHHMFCLTEENAQKYSVDKEWTILSTNYDKNGIKFVSSMENKYFPFAGVQFHPEKPAYEWNPSQDNPHNYLAILVNRYFYDWIVNISKYNNHRFPDKEMEKKRLIYNYKVTYLPNGYDLQLYLFDSKTI